jgi:hypothetical protein
MKEEANFLNILGALKILSFEEVDRIWRRIYEAKYKAIVLANSQKRKAALIAKSQEVI